MAVTKKALLTVLVAFLLSLMFNGCNCEAGSEGDPGSQGAGADSGTTTNNGGSGGDVFATSGGGSGSGGDDSCAGVEGEATFVNRPIDLIFVIDNSGSMSGEIAEVEFQINQTFYTILAAANPPIDYRVIMVSGYGNAVPNEEICIAEPLSTAPDMLQGAGGMVPDGHCDSLAATPLESANFFHFSPDSTTSVGISSYNALCRLQQTLTAPDEYNLHPNGYIELLRDTAFKFFVVVTDDRVHTGQQDGCTDPLYQDDNQVTDSDTDGDYGAAAAAAWDADILAASPTHFGDATNRNYSFWSIIAQEPYMATGPDDYGIPIDSTVPATTSMCDPGEQNPGTGYQELSILTGGYRFPSCAVENDNYAAGYSLIFEQMALGVIAGAQVPCQFEIPDPPAGEEIDLETVVLTYLSDGTLEDTFTQVDDLGSCADDHSFYLDLTLDQIILCPDACARVQADEDANVRVTFDCRDDIR
jgi:hypothetical protein